MMIGKIVTICKAIDRYDDVKLNQDSQIYLMCEPTNTADTNAIKVCVSEGDSIKQVGYLPKKLVQHIASYIDNGSSHPGLNDPGCSIACNILPPSPEGLSAKHDVYASFDMEIEFRSTTHDLGPEVTEEVTKLKQLIEMINLGESNRI